MKNPRNRNTLLKTVEHASEKHGFLHAWETHFEDLTSHHKGHGLQEIEQTLLRFVKADKHLQDLNLDSLKAEPQSDQGGILAEHAEIKEASGEPMLHYAHQQFENWGQTVFNNPALTMVPKTKAGLGNLVKWAKTNKKRVRAAGYRHTWGNLYSEDDEVFVSMLPLNDVERLPSPEPKIDPTNELQGIEMVGSVKENGQTFGLCKIGAATTNEQFRRWCLDPKGGNLEWTLPLNVIMVEITFGGSNAPICHGAGWNTKTLSDLVTSVEFINANGELQVVDDPKQLSAAAGAFGLLGIVTSITLKLDPMTFANMKPEKPRVALAVPPPAKYVVPHQIDMSGLSKEDLENAWTDFITSAKNDYYAEWFWFPYSKNCWVNTWKNDGSKSNSKDYPGPLGSKLQEIESYLMQVLNTTIFPKLPGKLQAQIMAHGAMVLLPADKTIVTPLIDALHFRRGIQNMRVWDMEFEIPLPPSPTDAGEPDWEICRQAWWAAISATYARSDAPMRIALEMRITRNSDVTMAPQWGNSLGTCSIEVLTTLDTDPKEWLSYMQDVVDEWAKLTDSSGAALNIRPHWAKMWQGLEIRGTPIVDYLRDEAYVDRLPEFKAALNEIAVEGSCSMNDLVERFSNPLLTTVFGLDSN